METMHPVYLCIKNKVSNSAALACDNIWFCIYDTMPLDLIALDKAFRYTESSYM